MRFLITLLIAVSVNSATAAAQSASTASTASPTIEERKAPEHVSTSWSTLAKDTARDYVTFPKRKSTWVILGIGAISALATHLEDDYVEEHVVGEKAADRFFSLGQWVGNSYVQIGSAVGLWAVGRYVVSPA